MTRVRTGGGVVSTGTYWDSRTWDLARSAYIADLDTDPDSPDAFIGWLQRALVDYAGLGPLRRAELAASIVLEPVASRGFSKAFPLQVEVVEALEQAIIDDRRELGRVVSRAGFVREAVTHAAQCARLRLGRDLPPAPARLPSPSADGRAYPGLPWSWHRSGATPTTKPPRTAKTRT
jgi:hypothetical protein